MTADPASASRGWAHGLAAWAIPQDVLAQAPESPWGFPPGVFVAAAQEALTAPPTPTHLRCAEALPLDGTLLDVGAGGGAASLPLAPPAARLVAVDESAAMLEDLTELARGRVAVQAVVGRWPDVAAEVPQADVVVCANVAYNVADLAPFVVALSAAARTRVVLELTAEHPLAWLSPLWQHFWGLERPTGPVADDALAVVTEALGVQPEKQTWTRPHALTAQHEDARVPWVRRRLCLHADADPEIAELLAGTGRQPVGMVTAWWAPVPR